jgi:hypothetical protein
VDEHHMLMQSHNDSKNELSKRNVEFEDVRIEYTKLQILDLALRKELEGFSGIITEIVEKNECLRVNFDILMSVAHLTAEVVTLRESSRVMTNRFDSSGSSEYCSRTSEVKLTNTIQQTESDTSSRDDDAELIKSLEARLEESTTKFSNLTARLGFDFRMKKDLDKVISDRV